MRTVGAWLVAGAVTVAVSLSGCSTQARPGAAVVVDDRSYSIEQVDRISAQLAVLTANRQRAQLLTIQLLVLGEDIRRLATDAGVVVSVDDAREAVRPGLEQAGLDADALDDDTLEIIASSLMGSDLAETPEGAAALAEASVDRDVTVNPRYGVATTDEQGRLVIDVAELPWLA